MEKNIRTLIVLTSAFLIADMATVKAADSNNPPTPINPPREIIIKSWKNPTSLRPKAPTRQQIECTYADGSLYFLFAIPEGECQLSMTDLSTGEVVYTDFDSEASEPVYIGYHESGEIYISTESGNTYSGSW